MSPCSLSVDSSSHRISPLCFFFFFNDTATTEIYTLSLHDALPISPTAATPRSPLTGSAWPARMPPASRSSAIRSEEHTSELQSRLHLVCRLLLEKKKNTKNIKNFKGVGVSIQASLV